MAKKSAASATAKTAKKSSVPIKKAKKPAPVSPTLLKKKSSSGGA